MVQIEQGSDPESAEEEGEKKFSELLEMLLLPVESHFLAFAKIKVKGFRLLMHNSVCLFKPLTSD